MPTWCVDAVTGVGEKGELFIRTLEGTMTAAIGDWLIKGVQGEVYPCKPDIFEKTYELIDGAGSVDNGSPGVA